MYLKPLLCFFILTLSIPSYAQKIKWGDPTDQEIALKECEYDPEAIAVVTWASGDISLKMGNPVTVERHIRKKVLKPEGKNIANVVITYFTKDKTDEIIGLKAQTINYDVNGQKVVTKLKNSDIVEVKVDENFSQYRFTFPDVKEGSILEYKYITVSKRYTFLEGWTFQNELPTLRSEFKISIDNRFIYMYYLQGQEIYKKYKQMPSDNHWVLENLPAIIDEPYSANRIDYIEKVRFQLVEYFNYDTNAYKKYLSDWNLVAKDYYNYAKTFTYLLDKNKPKLVDDFIERNSLMSFKGSNEDVLKQIYSFVNNTFILDDDAIYHSHPIQDIEELVKTRKGNQAEINLFFIYLCKLNNINAYPVQVSPRGNGKLLTQYPLSSQLDATFTYVELSGQEIFLDPTDPKRPFGMLKKDCLVESSVVFINKEKAEVKPIVYNFKNGEEFSCILDFKSSSAPIVQMLYKANGYDALNYRRNPDKIKSWFEEDGQYLIDSIDIKDDTLLAKPVSATIKLSLIDEFLDADILYIEPFISKNLDQNPFKDPKRIYPVDFGHTTNDLYRSSVIIPDGYIVDQKPENLILRTDNGEVEFSYQASINGSNVSFLAKLNINSNVVFPYSYESLRNLFTEAINKLNEPLVLKKIK